MPIPAPRKIVFVGGAPRSGTTVLHALICTSAQVSDHHPEISFFRGIPQSYQNGRRAWAHHTQAFFPAPEDFRRLMRETADLSLNAVSAALGDKPILAVKDPLLTPLFWELHELYPDKAWFAAVIRHPYDIVRSRQEVHERAGHGRPFGAAEAAALARDYMATYDALLSRRFSGRLFLCRYEDLGAELVQAGLAGFLGVDDLDVDGMWGASAGTDVQADAWASPKYNKPLDMQPRLSPLAPELKAVTAEICRPLMTRFGYA